MPSKGRTSSVKKSSAKGRSTKRSGNTIEQLEKYGIEPSEIDPQRPFRGKRIPNYRLIMGVQELILTDNSKLSPRLIEIKEIIIENEALGESIIYAPGAEDRNKLLGFIYGKISQVAVRKEFSTKFGVDEDFLKAQYMTFTPTQKNNQTLPGFLFPTSMRMLALDDDDEEEGEELKEGVVEEEKEKRTEGTQGSIEDPKGLLTLEEHHGAVDREDDVKEGIRALTTSTNNDHEVIIQQDVLDETTGEVQVTPSVPELISMFGRGELQAGDIRDMRNRGEITGDDYDLVAYGDGSAYTSEDFFASIFENIPFARQVSGDSVGVLQAEVLPPRTPHRTTVEPETLLPSGNASTVSNGSVFYDALGEVVDGDTRTETGTIPEFIGDGEDPEDPEKKKEKEIPPFGTFYTDQKTIKFEVKYHKVPFMMFFGSLNNPNIDKTLFESIMTSVETSILSKESIKALCATILTASKGEILVDSVIKGDLQELHELIQLYFCLHRDLMTGARIPMGKVPLNQLTNLSRIMNDSNTQFETGSGVKIQPETEAQVPTVSGILAPEEIDRRARMRSDELGISRPTSIFADIGRNVKEHHKKEIKIIDEPNLRIESSNIAVRNTDAYSHIKINFKSINKDEQPCD